MQYLRTHDGHFECPECHAIKRLQSTMHYHMKSHLQINRHVCPHCTKTFLQRRTMELHVAAKHTPIRTFACPLCPHATAEKGNLLVHCFRVHFKEEVQTLLRAPKDYRVCVGCEGAFSSSTAFHYHAKGCVKPTARMAVIKMLL